MCVYVQSIVHHSQHMNVCPTHIYAAATRINQALQCQLFKWYLSAHPAFLSISVGRFAVWTAATSNCSHYTVHMNSVGNNEHTHTQLVKRLLWRCLIASRMMNKHFNNNYYKTVIAQFRMCCSLVWNWKCNKIAKWKWHDTKSVQHFVFFPIRQRACISCLLATISISFFIVFAVITINHS